jgi:hypothetical protein
MIRLLGLRGLLALTLAWPIILAAGCAKDSGAPPPKPPEAKSPAGEKEPATPGTPEKGAAQEPSTSGKPAAGAAAEAAPPADQAADDEGWESVFDSKTLKNWKVTDFGGEGKVEVAAGAIILNMGVGDLTGITWAGGELARSDYEISLEAERLDGGDFFCGLTFPVKKSFASFICGGWGGTLCGLSSVDDFDASENETTKFKEFQTGRWYRIRVRVTDAKVECWIDDEQMVDLELGDHKISVRWEVESSQPLGVAAWRTKAAIRNFKIRRTF